MSRRARQRASARPWAHQHSNGYGKAQDEAERLHLLLSSLTASPPAPAAAQQPLQQANQHHHGSTPCSRQTHAHT